jgi:hypothetical protein
MKLFASILLIIGFLSACNNNQSDSSTIVNSNENKKDSAVRFFPVTSYLKGEIFGIKNGGVTPVRKITIGTKTDSTWLKMDELDSVMTDFLTPIIDSTNLINTFTESRFKDETLSAYTFTAEPKNSKENTFAFTHWDVYVDVETNKVKRIYLIKKESPTRELQLTWQCGKWCKIITISTESGKSVIEKEEKIYWSFE